VREEYCRAGGTSFQPNTKEEEEEEEREESEEESEDESDDKPVRTFKSS